MAVAGLVLGILSILTGQLGILFGIVGYHLSVKGRVKLELEGRPTGITTAGVVLNIIGLSIGLIATIFMLLFGKDKSFTNFVLLIAITVIAVIWIQWQIGKAIARRLSKETGTVLGVILIVIGVSIFIGIPIIIYSKKEKE
jgi:hypothetical protein